MKLTKVCTRLLLLFLSALLLQSCYTVPNGAYPDRDSWKDARQHRPAPADKAPDRRSQGTQRTFEAATVSPAVRNTVTYGRDRIFAYDAIIKELAQTYSIDYYLMLALGQAESSGNPNAVSSANCRGLTQLSLPTARDYDSSLEYNDLHNPQTNLKIAAQHMRTLRRLVHQHFPDAELEQRVILITAAWNAGWSRVKQARGVPNYTETRQLAGRVLKLYRKYRWGTE